MARLLPEYWPEWIIAVQPSIFSPHFPDDGRFSTL
jgi:hypothetical protein